MRSVPTGTVQLQSTMRVSSPRDSAEREADTTARRIMRMASPEVAVASGEGSGGPRDTLHRKLESPYIARFASSIQLMRQHAAASTANVSASVASEIAHSQGAGAPLPAGVRKFMEPRFGADFSKVRIHTGEKSARLNRQVSAQAFTVGNQIFFGRNQFRPDTPEGKELIAHELTHTIQQGAAVQQGAGVQRREDVTVAEQSSPHVQRLGISDALGYFADAANALPGYRMFTIVLGVNPITMSRVDRGAANILRAIVEFLPGGALITRALDNYGVFARVGGWIEQQLATLGLTGSSIRESINRFLDSLSWTDLANLDGVWARASRIFTEPIDRILRFARGLFGAIMGFIRDAVLRPIAELASRTRGWNLLCAVLGVNPITGEAVPRTAESLIGGFMKLIGQEEIWENIKRGNAIARAWSWFQNALSGVLGFVRQIPQRFVQAVTSLEVEDLVLLPRAFARVAGVFGDFIGNFLSWAGRTAWDLLEIIFSVVAPSLMVYLRRAGSALRTILQNPVAFAGHLVRAAVQGFRQFSARFLTHLRGSLIGWLTGALSGANIYIPQGMDLREIIKFVLSVLGLTWQNIRQKIVRVIGEPAMRALETGFELVTTLVTQGPAAAWEKIQEGLTNLREMVMEQIMAFVQDRVVTAAVTRLLSMLSPAGAFIQAILATYNTVMFFVERLRQLSQVAASFIDSIAAIAAGNITSAANRVEQTMGGLLTLVISFLARIAGLGRVTDAVTNVVNRVRQPIDRALDRVVEWIVAQARRLGRLAVGAASSIATRVSGWLGLRLAFRTNGESHTLFFRGEGASARLVVASDEQTIDVLLADNGAFERQIIALGSPAAITALRTAKAENTLLKAAQAILQRTPEDPAAIRQLRTSFNSLALQLSVMGVSVVSDADLPDTTITHVANGARAGSVTASPLTKKGSGGSRPDANIIGWSHVLTIDAGNWERVHLVSEDFHGPGRFWNLVPARRTDNAWMREGPERTIKTLRDRNAVLYYHVQVNSYHVLTHPVTGAAIDGFPESISVTLSTMKKSGTNWIRDVPLSAFPVKSLAPPQLTGGNRLDLKTANHQALQAMGIPRGIARNVGEVKGSGRFADINDFQTRMQARYASLRTPYNVEFMATYWPLFQALISSGRAFF